MNVRKIPITDNHPYEITLGRKGEFCIEKIIFDLSNFIRIYGEGYADVVFIAPNETVEQPVVMERGTDGKTVEWTITAGVMAKAGEGTARVYFYPIVAGRKISGEVKCRILEGATSGDEPCLVADWVHHAENTKDEYVAEGRRIVADAKAEADRSHTEAESSKEFSLAAKESEEKAKTSEENAKRSESGSAMILESVKSEGVKIGTEITSGLKSISDAVETGENTINSKVTSGTNLLDNVLTGALNTVVDAERKAKSNVAEAGTEAVDAVDSARIGSISAISKAHEESMVDITKASTDGLNAITEATKNIGTAKDSAIASIKTQETASKKVVTDAQTMATTAIGTAKTNALNEFNEDATVQRVADLETAKSELSESITNILTRLKSGKIEDSELHLGFYLDENGDLCQKEVE